MSLPAELWPDYTWEMVTRSNGATLWLGNGPLGVLLVGVPGGGAWASDDPAGPPLPESGPGEPYCAVSVPSHSATEVRASVARGHARWEPA